MENNGLSFNFISLFRFPLKHEIFFAAQGENWIILRILWLFSFSFRLIRKETLEKWEFSSIKRNLLWIKNQPKWVGHKKRLNTMFDIFDSNFDGNFRWQYIFTVIHHLNLTFLSIEFEF